MGRQIDALAELKKYVRRDERPRIMIHCAVQREEWKSFKIPYKHHFIMLAHTWTDEDSCKIIHYASRPNEGRVLQEFHSKEDFEKDIIAGFYIYTSNAYPMTDQEYSVSYQRFKSRENESQFSFRSNNCEHLVSFILTGVAVSRQVEEASSLTYCLMGVIDRRMVIVKAAAAAAAAAAAVPIVMSFRKGNLPTPLLKVMKKEIINRRLLVLLPENIDQIYRPSVRVEALPLVISSLMTFWSFTQK